LCWPFSSGGLEITREITIGQHEDYLCVRVIVGLLTVPVVVPATSRKARCKNLARMLDGLVACAVDQRRWDRALRLAAAASVLRAKLGSRLPPSRLATLERMLLAARSRRSGRRSHYLDGRDDDGHARAHGTRGRRARMKTSSEAIASARYRG
jgi:hypothetical protein